ncbi:MAG: CopG family ribbon-helix-helix protein [Candidatus Woesearchaeota archaeon]|jgi:CopG family nickel-responsive transcriptional regulator
MPIISLSLNEKIVEDIDYLQKKLGYSGRSEVVRSAIRSFISDKEKNSLLEKNDLFHATLSVIVPEHSRNILHKVEHEYGNLIQTRIHQCISEESCLNVFILSGKGSEIKRLVEELESLPKVENVQLFLAR